ncbi:MAG TPA: hypothetical protein VGM33_18845 [Baekduia sp.]|jgi:hypothetical protein
MNFQKMPRILSMWERKQQSHGATRRACASCGVHAFVTGAQIATCTCCGSTDLRPVTGGAERPAAPVVVLVRA